MEEVGLKRIGIHRDTCPVCGDVFFFTADNMMAVHGYATNVSFSHLVCSLQCADRIAVDEAQKAGMLNGDEDRDSEVMLDNFGCDEGESALLMPCQQRAMNLRIATILSRRKV